VVLQDSGQLKELSGPAMSIFFASPFVVSDYYPLTILKVLQKKKSLA